MFTEEIYRQYFVEIHRKQRQMIILLRHGLGQISDDRMQKALTWHMKREIRLAVLMQKLVRLLSPGTKIEKEQDTRSDLPGDNKFPFEVGIEGPNER